MEKSNISLTSNIMLKERYINDIKGRQFVPYHLLSKEEKDSRATIFLSSYQREQQDKQLFASYIFVNKDDSIMMCDETYLNNNEFYPSNIREIKNIASSLGINNIILLVDKTKKNYDTCLLNLKRYISDNNLCENNNVYLVPNEKYNSYLVFREHCALM